MTAVMVKIGRRPDDTNTRRRRGCRDQVRLEVVLAAQPVVVHPGRCVMSSRLPMPFSPRSCSVPAGISNRRLRLPVPGSAGILGRMELHPLQTARLRLEPLTTETARAILADDLSG